jgi:hypothetical protein
MRRKRPDMRLMLRRVHLDFHTPEFPPGALARFDARGLAETLKRSKVQVANFFAKCHYGNSYYFTEAGHRHSALKTDMLRDFIEAAHEREIAVGVYYSLWVDDRACRENPDWEIRQADGSPAGGNFRRPCISSPYTEELAVPQIREILTGYEPEALWFDFTIPGYCACQYCRQAFRQETGQQIPASPGDAGWATYAQSRRRQGVSFLRRVRRMADQLRPGTHLAGNWAFTSVQPEAIPLDSITYTTCDPPTTQLNQVNFSFEGRYLGRAGLPYELITTRFHEGWGDWTVKPVEALKAEMATIMAAGGTCNIGDQMYPDGSVEPAVYAGIEEAFSFVKEREEACIGTQSVPCIAVLNGAASLYLDRDPGAHYDEAMENVRGAHLALSQSGTHFDVLNEDSLASDLGEYQALVVPDHAALRKESAEAVARFVSRGGVLVATYRFCLRGEDGRPRSELGLSEVLGVQYRGMSPYSNCYIACDDRNLLEGLPAMPILVKGASAFVAPITARPLARLVHPLTENAPGRFISHRQAPPGAESGFPAITYEEYGTGKAFYVAADIFRAFWRTGDPRLRRLVANLLNVAVDKKRLSVDAPPSVEAFLRRREGELFLHLVNCHEEKRVAGFPTLEQMPAAGEVQVRLMPGKRVAGVQLVPGGESLAFTQRAGTVSFTVPQVGISQVVRIALK